MATDAERRYRLHRELRLELRGTGVKFSAKKRTFVATQDLLDGLPPKVHNKILECVQRYQYNMQHAMFA